MILFKIDNFRFYSEYQKYIMVNPKKDIEWNIDSLGILRMYILTDFNFGYLFEVKYNELPENLNGLMNQKGRFFEYKEL